MAMEIEYKETHRHDYQKEDVCPSSYILPKEPATRDTLPGAVRRVVVVVCIDKDNRGYNWTRCDDAWGGSC